MGQAEDIYDSKNNLLPTSYSLSRLSELLHTETVHLYADVETSQTILIQNCFSDCLTGLRCTDVIPIYPSYVTLEGLKYILILLT